MMRPFLLGVAVMLAGCAQSTKPAPLMNVKFQKQEVAPITNTDPCATRLQDISGDLLLFYATNHHLPEKLSELADVPGRGATAEFVCPVSHQPYIYNAAGIAMPDGQSRVVLFDATPVHSGMRWAITVSDSRPGKPLVMKVIALRESFFKSAASAK